MGKSNKSKYKIIVQGTKIVAKYLKEELSIPSAVYFSSKQDTKFFKLIKQADVLVSMSWGKSMWGGSELIKIPETNNLKLLHIPGAGTDGINFEALPKNTKLCNVYEHEIPIAEYCIANMLNWEMQLIKKISTFKKLDWKDCIIFSGPTHGELFNKNVGILGYGRIGIELAKRLKNFGMNVFAYTRREIKKDRYLDKVFSSKKMEKNLKDLDYLILACPLNKSTEGIINKNNLKYMKKSAVIINIARGQILNEKDMYEFLKSKKIGGAIIDTWFRYPKMVSSTKFKPSNFNYHKLSNVVMTPHISAWSENMIIRRSSFIKKNIENLYYNKKLLNLIKY